MLLYFPSIYLILPVLLIIQQKIAFQNSILQETEWNYFENLFTN